MTYVPTTWTSGVTKVGPTNLNKLELGVQATAAVADAALPTPAGSDGQFLQRVSGVWVPHTLVAADMPSGIALSKLADPGAGNVVTSAGAGAIAAKPPGYEFAHNEFTSNVSLTATTEATANTIVTASAVTFDGSTVVLIDFFCPELQGGSSGAVTLWLYDGASSIGALGSHNLVNPSGIPVRVTRRLTPSAAAHTYSVRASVGGGTGTANASTGGTAAFFPGFIRIMRAA